MTLHGYSLGSFAEAVSTMGDSQCGGAGDHAVILLIEVLLWLLIMQWDDITNMNKTKPDAHNLSTQTLCTTPTTHRTPGHAWRQLQSSSDRLASWRSQNAESRRQRLLGSLWGRWGAGSGAGDWFGGERHQRAGHWGDVKDIQAWALHIINIYRFHITPEDVHRQHERNQV